MGDSALDDATADFLTLQSRTIAYDEPIQHLLRQVVVLAAPLRVALVGGRCGICSCTVPTAIPGSACQIWIWSWRRASRESDHRRPTASPLR
ncbi:hypothetical protein AAJV73_01500 [Cyanobium sp. BSA11S]|uniref:hypothetical protein n=1 Tax=Cyanobium sp. BSA11S TaxID=3108224 RepID=UPI003D81BC26